MELPMDDTHTENKIPWKNLWMTTMIHWAGHQIPNLLSSLFGIRSFAAFTFYKVWFLGVPFKDSRYT